MVLHAMLPNFGNQILETRFRKKRRASAWRRGPRQTDTRIDAKISNPAYRSKWLCIAPLDAFWTQEALSHNKHSKTNGEFDLCQDLLPY